MGKSITGTAGWLALLLTVQTLSGCAGLSDDQRQQVGGAIFFAAIAGIAEAVQSAAVRERARNAVSLPWSCSTKRIKASLVRELSDNSHIVRVHGCGHAATLQCGGRTCWELAPPGTFSSR